MDRFASLSARGSFRDSTVNSMDVPGLAARGKRIQVLVACLIADPGTHRSAELCWSIPGAFSPSTRSTYASWVGHSTQPRSSTS